MTTVALPRKQIKALYGPAVRTTYQYSSFAVASIICVGLFLAYLGIYQTSALESLSHSASVFWNVLFIMVAPALALFFSIKALRKYMRTRTDVKGMFLAYISFFVSALYFMTALAMPIVLLGMYAMYVYIW